MSFTAEQDEALGIIGRSGAGNAYSLRVGNRPAFMLVELLIGVVIFNRVEKTFIDTV